MADPGSDSDLIRAPGTAGPVPAGQAPTPAPGKGTQRFTNALQPSAGHGIPSGVHGIPSGVHGIPSGVHGVPTGARPSNPGMAAQRQSGQVVVPPLAGASNNNPTVAQPAAESPSRMVLAGYELLSELGRGSSGTVYLARRAGGGPVALKVLAGKAAKDPEARARFVREATVSSRVTHPGIVRVLDAGEAQSHLYIAMEFIAGTTLRDRLASAPLTPLEAARVVSLVARAIEAAHEAGIVHRDLKPGNILLDRAGRPHVADFGLARDELSRDRLTLSGDVLGTPLYMSPEQVRGQRVERAADVWALGVILWECIAGKVPFAGRSFPEVAQNIQRWSPVAPSSLAIYSVPRSLDMLCLAALEADPRSRPSAAELALDLEAVANDVSSKQLATRPRRRWGIVLAGATAASAGILLGAATMRAVDLQREHDLAAEMKIRLERATEGGEGLSLKLEDAMRLAHASDAEAKHATEIAEHLAGEMKLALARNDVLGDQLAHERLTWGGNLASVMDRAIEDLAVAPISSATAELRGRLLLHRGRYDEAQRTCTEARLTVEELEDDPELLRIEAEAHLKMGRSREAFVLADRLIRGDAKGARGQFAQALMMLQSAKSSEVGQLLRQLEHTADLDHRFEAGLTVAASFLIEAPDSETLQRAQADADRALRIDPTSAEAYFQRSMARWSLAMNSLRRGQRVPVPEQDAIVRDLECARAIDPRPEFFALEGKVYCMFERAGEALPPLDAALQISSPRSKERAMALAWRGNVAALLKNPKRALEDWLEAMSLSPRSSTELLGYVSLLPPEQLEVWLRKAPPEFVKEYRAREAERRAGR